MGQRPHTPDRPAGGPLLEPVSLGGDAAALAQPGHDVDGRVIRAAGEGSAGADEALKLDRRVRRQLLHREQGAEVVGDRVKAAGVHQPGPGPLGLLVMAQPHQVDELRLAGEVDVVGAGGGAGRDHRLAVVDIGADGRDHDLRRLGQPAHRRRVGDVGHQQRPVGGGGIDRRQARSRTASSLRRSRPASAHRVRPAGGSEVFGGQCPGETGRAEDDDVVFALSHRRGGG